MAHELLERVTAALPDEARVLHLLNELPDSAWEASAEALRERLPEFEAVLTADGQGGAFARALADRAGVPLAVAYRSPLAEPHYQADHWSVEQRPLAGRGQVLIAVPLTTDGILEMELVLLARQAGVDAAVCVCAVELTSRGARTRLDMLGVRIVSDVQLAHTPDGLKVEQRGQNGELLVPM